MGNVGLLLVGVVLFVNGLSSLGYISGRSAAPLNIFVGAIQVLYPTLIILQAAGDADTINGAWPSLLFGFTYLWFGWINLADLDPKGFGWYSIFVVAIAAYQALITLPTDPVFGIIWAVWGSMWLLFFLLLGLGISQAGRVDLGRFTGWYLTFLGIPTCTVAGIALLRGAWSAEPAAWIGSLLIVAVAIALSARLAARPAPAPTAEPDPVAATAAA